MENNIRKNRWRLILGKLAEQNLPLDLSNADNIDIENSLQFLFDREYDQDQEIVFDAENGDNGENKEAKSVGGRGESQLIATWLQNIKRLFPKEAVEVFQKKAIEEYDMTYLLTDPEVLKTITPNMDLLKNVLMFKNMMSREVLEVAKSIIRAVVEELKEKLKSETVDVLSYKKNPNKRSYLKNFKNFDFKRTVQLNLKNYNKQHRTIIPSQLYFNSRINNKERNEYKIIILLDQSGSMLDSLIYSSIMASIFYELPAIETKLVLFDTSIVDVSDKLSDTIETLLSVQLGGGTDIYKALEYGKTLITEPNKTMFILISDLYDGNDLRYMYKSISDIIEGGSKMFVLPALDYYCNSSYDKKAAQHLANMGANVAAITPKELAEWIAKVIN